MKPGSKVRTNGRPQDPPPVTVLFQVPQRLRPWQRELVGLASILGVFFAGLGIGAAHGGPMGWVWACVGFLSSYTLRRLVG